MYAYCYTISLFSNYSGLIQFIPFTLLLTAQLCSHFDSGPGGDEEMGLDEQFLHRQAEFG